MKFQLGDNRRLVWQLEIFQFETFKSDWRMKWISYPFPALVTLKERKRNIKFVGLDEEPLQVRAHLADSWQLQPTRNNHLRPAKSANPATSLTTRSQTQPTPSTPIAECSINGNSIDPSNACSTGAFASFRVFELLR